MKLTTIWQATSVEQPSTAPRHRPALYPDLEYLGIASRFSDDIFEILSGDPVFEDFRRPEIDALCQFMHCYACPRRYKLLEEDTSGDHLLVMLSGKVVVEKRDRHGKNVVIAIVKPGSILGEMSIFDGQPRFASCIAIEPTDVAVMTHADLNNILIDHPRLANKLLIKMMQIQIDRVREIGHRLVDHLPAPVAV